MQNRSYECLHCAVQSSCSERKGFNLFKREICRYIRIPMQHGVFCSMVEVHMSDLPNNNCVITVDFPEIYTQEPVIPATFR